MIYQLDTNFTLLNEKSGIIDNLSSYATVEYTTAKDGAIPAINTGIRVQAGGKLRFSVDSDTQSFVRFTFTRSGDYTRTIAVVDNDSDGFGNGLEDIADAIRNHQCNITQNNHCCCKCHCGDDNPDNPEPVDDWQIIALNTEPAEDKRVWLNTGTPLQPSNNPPARMDFSLDQVTNLIVSDTEPSSYDYWIKPI